MEAVCALFFLLNQILGKHRDIFALQDLNLVNNLMPKITVHVKSNEICFGRLYWPFSPIILIKLDNLTPEHT